MADANVLFTEHERGVFRYLCRIVGHPEAARDLTQEVFLRVVRAPVPATTDEGRRAWVFRIARNLALNHLRDGRRRPVAVELAESTRPATQDVRAALGEALAHLPEVERDVFLMRETAGLTYDEIAVACDLSTDAVRSRLHHARQLLRAALEVPVSLHRQRGIRIGK